MDLPTSKIDLQNKAYAAVHFDEPKRFGANSETRPHADEGEISDVAERRGEISVGYSSAPSYANHPGPHGLGVMR